ncbi:family 16 glycoside hydrolase [Actinomadura sp. 6N118]|uniref:family 16 glycoside hydrolase n=1 Tax=Actinomadura sp. 6N118 TaxID=3375151 RepID=UPI00378FA827
MTNRRWPLALALTAALTAVAVVVVPDYGDTDFVQWRDDTVHGSWRAVYDGHGRNGIRDGVITLRPQPSTTPTETHAGLIVSLNSYENPSFRLRVRTVAQLRNVRPNPWESAWVIWHYTDDHHFYYLALKPNGWELGKRDPAYPGGQRFLATGLPPFALKRWYDIRVDQKNTTMTARANGRTLTTFTDTERPYTKGSVGLYTEDAEVEFRNIRARG